MARLEAKREIKARFRAIRNILVIRPGWMGFPGELSRELDSADDAVGRGLDGFRLLEDVVEGGAELTHAAVGEASGAGMAVEGRMVWDAVVTENGGGAAPVKVIFLDGLALGMVADVALASVAWLPGRFGLGESRMARPEQVEARFQRLPVHCNLSRMSVA